MDNAQLMLVKKEVLNTMATRGWYFVNERASAVIQKMMTDAIDQEDEGKSKTAVTEARAAKKFWNSLIQSLQISTQISDSETEDNDGWNEVSM
jgi:hypothetical protein